MINMRTLAVRSIRANPTRFVATLLAVLVSTGFLAGTLVLRDSLGASLEATIRGQLKGVDLVVSNTAGLASGPTETPPTSGAPSSTVEPGGATGSTTPASTSAPAETAGVTRETTGREPTSGPVAGGQTRVLGVNQNVPVSLLDQVRTVPGVGDAAGVLNGYLSVLDGKGGSIAENVPGTLWMPPAALNPYKVVEGRAPTAAGEVAIDQHTVDEGGLVVGRPVQLATTKGLQEATLVGILNYGDQPSSARGDVVVSEADAFRWFAEGRSEYNSIYVAAAPGVSANDLAAAVSKAVAPFTVETGDQLRDAATSGIGGFVDIISGALVGFAFVALVVALFTIYNTFSIIVHQRTREFALLRAIGASGLQIKRSVRVEAVILGLGSSAAGFVLGVILFNLLTRLLPQFHDIAGNVTTRIRPLSVLIVLGIGTLVTTLSAVIPAWRAARTRPLEAMRSVTVDRSASSRGRAIVGLVLLGLGVLILVLGSFHEQFLVMMIGPPLLFLGVLVAGPVLAAVFGRLIEIVLSPFSGATMRLGAENVQRNPRRSAATALALVIGVFLVVLVTAGGGAVRDYAVTQLTKLGGSDVSVIAFGGELPADYVKAVRAVDGVSGAAEVYLNIGLVTNLPNMGEFGVSAVDYRDSAALGLAYDQGDPTALGSDEVIVPGLVAAQANLALGDPIEVHFATGQKRNLRVGAITKPGLVPYLYMSADTAREADPAIVPLTLEVTAESGRAQEVTDAITALSRNYAGLEVTPGNFFATQIRRLFNFVIAAANGLLGVAVIIALFGIVNTLVLSVSERTREIGLLRAVGMTRRQVGATIRLESVAVSLLGALVGTVFGLFVAWCLTRPIFADETASASGFSWPVSHLVAILVLAVIVGLGASIVPARRASRLNIIEAVTVE